MSEFPCTQCSLCCRKISEVLSSPAASISPLVKRVIDAFPYKADETGSCEMLVDGKCSVYENRPDICNVDTMADLHGVPREVWYRFSASGCNALIKEAGLDESFLITDYDQ
jgi:hypothetical protein